jgi:hypothetical protein
MKVLGQAADGPGLRKVVLALLASGELQALADELRPALLQAVDDVPGSAAEGGTAAAAPQPQADPQVAAPNKPEQNCTSPSNAVEATFAAGEEQHQQQQEQEQPWQQQQQRPQLKGQQQEEQGTKSPRRPPFPGVYWMGTTWQAKAGLPDTNGKLRDTHILNHADHAVAMAAREVALLWKVHVQGLASARQPAGLLHAR